MTDQTSNTGIAADRLRSIIERIENLMAERKGLGEDIKDIFAEAKGAGFDTKIVRDVIKRRAADAAEMEEQDQLRDLYLQALGMY